MLYVTTPPDATPAPVKVTTGRGLAYALRRATATKRVDLALDLIDGGLKNPTKQQACTLAGVSLHHVNMRRKTLTGGNGHKREMTNAQIDRLIITIGPDRILAGLDRYTQPQLQLAAE